MWTLTLILEHLWNTRPSFPLGAESLSSQRRIKLKLNTLKIPLAPTSQQGSFQVMIVGTHHIQKQKESKTFERNRQNTTKITSALADSCIQSPWPVMSISMRILCLCLVLMNLLFSIAPPSFNFATMAVLRDRRLLL